ncbi:SCAN domain-containing protein 3-like [Centruroides sculpturatus]|uniref:SCAN domain-containing protein 3-like n=1 Tax=Centruroides sculpturatus TaxID=218467 RepID=UPI000C6D04DB|nr:SCAN domain-containing protein 3-like [Centruroides sculpturatus]
MDNWLNLSKKDNDAEDSATKSPQAGLIIHKQSSNLRKRKYNESFLQFGFTFKNHNGNEQPFCLICNELLATESMKPSKLKRHLESKHTSYANKPKEYFERLLKSLNKDIKSFEEFTTINEKYLLASYEVSYCIAKNKKPFTIGEDLVLPAAIKMVEILHGSKYSNDIRKIPLSNDTVANRISEISNDQLVQLITRIKESPKFSIQLDETTDITKLAQLLVYVRYVYKENIEEELLFCRPLKDRTRGKDIYCKVDEFLKTEGLEWKNCCGVCTDGAKAMTGQNIGFKSFFKAAHYDHITFTHCLIHREALAAKKLAPELNDVLQDAVKIINFIKSHALNSRLFSNLCKDADSHYTNLLLHAEVRWISRGQSLRRLLLLKDEIEIFLTEQKCDLATYFQNDLWLSKLCYLSDIFEKLNDLNLSLQGKNCNIFTSNDKIESFIKKIKIWQSRVEKNSFEMFSSIDNFISEKNHCKTFIAKIIIGHLKALETQFRKYFKSNIDFKSLSWIQKPFLIGLDEIDHLPYKAQEEFAELSSDSNLKLDFSKKPLTEFWIRTRTEFPTISNMALNVLLPFNTTYLCEITFSALTHIKSQYRSSLNNVEEILRSAMANIAPRFSLLCSKKQAHPSH